MDDTIMEKRMSEMLAFAASAVAGSMLRSRIVSNTWAKCFFIAQYPPNIPILFKFYHVIMS